MLDLKAKSIILLNGAFLFDINKKTSAKKNDLLLRKVILILTQNFFKLFSVYLNSFRITIDSEAFDNSAYFKAVYPFSFFKLGRAPFANKTLRISCLL